MRKNKCTGYGICFEKKRKMHTDLIDNNVRHPIELGVCLEPAEQNARRHEEQFRVLARASLKADLVTDSPADSFAAFGSYTLGHT